MKITTLLLTTLAGSGLAIAAATAPEGAGLEQRQTCAIPNVGCYSQRDCCGGLKCNFSESCCIDGGDGDGLAAREKRQNCGCCVK
ncbi:hypothetical protein ISF_00119 [Cordyceps fumosorosea ARSEF 2679]|uniref:Uncharacterized protein n=1 Tax=Cordyceps fumosorosea (strain ARSEF 2679) TaxID=1081104 RepID=A0A168E075_CORFA|nr:hypothetical protein ISF_00119 [Cordyceps fumosorosea ARSEF 2679]OAA73218.1 hypothetical protein ISF_00119 [Cordyceps fumosorosea ARSEF 2679]